MIFGLRCFPNTQPIPCDLDWSVEAIVVVAALFAGAIVALGFLALLAVMARGKG